LSEKEYVLNLFFFFHFYFVKFDQKKVWQHANTTCTIWKTKKYSKCLLKHIFLYNMEKRPFHYKKKYSGRPIVHITYSTYNLKGCLACQQTSTFFVQKVSFFHLGQKECFSGRLLYCFCISPWPFVATCHFCVANFAFRAKFALKWKNGWEKAIESQDNLYFNMIRQ
jgi:hypothetical protein